MPILALLSIDEYLGHAARQLDQVERRLLKGETNPQNEKVFRYLAHLLGGKRQSRRAGGVGRTGVLVEDQFQFLLHHKIMWQDTDVDVAVSMVEETQARFADFRMCSFDRGFHSPNNRRRLDEMLELNALPRKGYLSQAEREREQEPEFAAMRRQHPAVESAINNLEHRGLERVRSHGAGGFERTVALAISGCQPASHWSAAAAPRARNPPAAEKGAFARRLKLRHQIRRLPRCSHSDGNGCQCLFSGEWHRNWRNRFQMDCAAVFLTVSTAKNEKKLLELLPNTQNNRSFLPDTN